MKRTKRLESISDDDIIYILRNDSTKENVVIDFLYKRHYEMVKKLIRGKGGNLQDVQDVFQEAVIVFYEQVKSGKFQTQAKISTYLYAVSRNLWINRMKRDSKIIHDEIQDEKMRELTVLPKDQLTENDEKAFIKLIMDKMGDDCKKVLTSSIYLEKSMKTIATEMGYDNEQIARNKKYRCIQKLKKIIEDSVNLTSLLDELR